MTRSTGTDLLPLGEMAGRERPILRHGHRKGSLLSSDRSRTVLECLLVAGIGLVARLYHIRTAYDAFVDEPTYVNVAGSVRRGLGVELYGKPFDLHPATVFAGLAAVESVFGLRGDPLDLVLSLRPAIAICGAMAAVALYLAIRPIVPRPVAVIAGVALALDPFANLFDSRVLLEAPTELAGVVCVGLLIAVVARTPESNDEFRELGDGQPIGRVDQSLLLALAGVAAAVDVTSKETFGLVLALLLAIILAMGWPLPRPSTVLVLSEAAVGYGIYLVSVGLSNGFSPWWDQQGAGIRRLLGLKQITGFNAASTHVTLTSRATANLDRLGSSYVLLGLGAFAAGILFLRLGAWRRDRRRDASWKERGVSLVVLWTLVSAIYVSYATLFGTIEEQTFYILLAPAIASLACAGAYCITAASKWVSVLVVVFATAVLLVDSGSWIAVHTESNDAYKQLLTWQGAHVRPGSRIALLEGEAQFFLTADDVGEWNDVRSWRAHRVQYVLVATELDKEGYASVSSSTLDILASYGRVAFCASSVSLGDLVLYDVHDLVSSSRIADLATARPDSGPELYTNAQALSSCR